MLKSVVFIDAEISVDDNKIHDLGAVKDGRIYFFIRPLRKFCVSVFRQNQEYHIINVHDWGLFPLATAFPGGWDGMRALRGVNAVPASRES